MHQTLQQDKFEDADFKYDNDIFKVQLKNLKQHIFDPKFKDFLFLLQLSNETNLRELILNMAILFKNSSLKTPK